MVTVQNFSHGHKRMPSAMSRRILQPANPVVGTVNSRATPHFIHQSFNDFSFDEGMTEYHELDSSPMSLSNSSVSSSQATYGFSSPPLSDSFSDIMFPGPSIQSPMASPASTADSTVAIRSTPAGYVGSGRLLGDMSEDEIEEISCQNTLLNGRRTHLDGSGRDIPRKGIPPHCGTSSHSSQESVLRPSTRHSLLGDRPSGRPGNQREHTSNRTNEANSIFSRAGTPSPHGRSIPGVLRGAVSTVFRPSGCAANDPSSRQTDGLPSFPSFRGRRPPLSSSSSSSSASIIRPRTPVPNFELAAQTCASTVRGQNCQNMIPRPSSAMAGFLGNNAAPGLAGYPQGAVPKRRHSDGDPDDPYQSSVHETTSQFPSQFAKPNFVPDLSRRNSEMAFGRRRMNSFAQHHRSVRFNDNPICPSPILPSHRRQGWYNRRGDQLWTNGGYYKPPGRECQYPLDLAEYPEFGEGWMNEIGTRIDMQHRLIPKVPSRSALKVPRILV